VIKSMQIYDADLPQLSSSSSSSSSSSTLHDSLLHLLHLIIDTRVAACCSVLQRWCTRDTRAALLHQRRVAACCTRDSRVASTCGVSLLLNSSLCPPQGTLGPAYKRTQSPVAALRDIGMCHISVYVDVYRYIVWQRYARTASAVMKVLLLASRIYTRNLSAGLAAQAPIRTGVPEEEEEGGGGGGGGKEEEEECTFLRALAWRLGHLVRALSRIYSYSNDTLFVFK